MNLLITGGCGFIGSNFINTFFYKHVDINIINLDALYYCANEANILPEIRASDRYNLVKGNLCSFDLVAHILDNYSIDLVIHFAAQSHVQNSFNDSLQYTHDNIVGTHTLLEAVRLYGKIKKFIHISTDEVYGESMISEDEQKKILEQIAKYVLENDLKREIAFAISISVVNSEGMYVSKNSKFAVDCNFLATVFSSKTPGSSM